MSTDNNRAEAIDLISNDDRWVQTDETPMETYAEAQVRATLALVDEQRTANLIAVATARFADGSQVKPGLSDALWQQITERLGLA